VNEGEPDAVEVERAEAATRTGDTLITSVDRMPQQVPPSRAKPHGQEDSAPLRWRPKTSNDSDVDPA
jgi:hypothetical protein